MDVEPMRVLVVDDEEEFVHTLVERLNLRGLEVEGVTSGADALERIEAGRFDVVLLDLKMPGLGGLDVIREIKEARPGVAVILLTGHGSAQDAEAGISLGAFDYLMKPIKIEELMRKLLKASDSGAGAAS